mmetsp:Transcript_23805/g.33409  ORF Transcript_23805/g.33409 Transcript_23805/m.33409 type:complete len:432 (+) Transcript_23805:22-1317(+)
MSFRNTNNNDRIMRSMQQVSVLGLFLTSMASLSSSSSSPLIGFVAAFTTTTTPTFSSTSCRRRRNRHMSLDRQSTTFLHQQSRKNEWQDSDNDANKWRSMDDPDLSKADTVADDWQAILQQKQDGSYWSTFESVNDGEDDTSTAKLDGETMSDDSTEEEKEEVDAEAWLDTLAALGAEEIEFNLKEADRADKARQMEEWGFDKQTIQNTLEVAVDATLESADETMVQFEQEAYYDEDDIDYTTVESHTQVELDPDTNEPIRTQMVYVDEHTCIGCTHCATIAQSTFFMEDDYGRARVFSQWGDDDETIQIAIETCPVDCIHYVPYEELKRLEIDRRGQTINFKARLVSQGEVGTGLSHRVGGANAYSAPQVISGNMGSRCNNCPSRGCKNCPMYGVGKNPEFERREKERKAKAERRRLEKERASQNKSADL